MQTIKFRGLRDVEGGGHEMVFGQVGIDANQNCVYSKTHPDRISWKTETGGSVNAPVRKGTVGQFSGNFAKHGKEIYNGDIISCDNCLPDRDRKFEVFFEEGMFFIKRFYGDMPKTPLCWFSEEAHIDHHGNIHENPELRPKY